MTMFSSHFKVLCIVAFLLVALSSSAQFNIKVGYIGKYAQFSKTDDIFNEYNQAFGLTDKKLKPIRLYNGVEFGVRYKMSEYFAFDIGMSTALANSKAEGVQISSNTNIDNEWKSSLTDYYVGIENYYGIFGFGGTIGMQKLKYKNQTSLQSESLSILDQSVLNSRFYLIFEGSSDMSAYSLRPFVSVNWESYNVSSVNNQLLPNDSRPASDFIEDALIFGLSIMIYNGPQ